MALLASVNLNTPNTDVQVYQCPIGQSCAFTINLVNRTTNNGKISIAITNTTTVAPENWIEFERDLFKPVSFTKTGLIIGSGQYVYVRSNISGISINLWGVQK